jgi:hypothetical protein
MPADDIGCTVQRIGVKVAGEMAGDYPRLPRPMGMTFAPAAGVVQNVAHAVSLLV